jgi:hypothetical protein
MKWFDTHIHSEGRSVEDLKRMADAGIEFAVTCAFYPIPPEHPETLLDLFRKLEIFEVKRGEKAGMSIFPALGVHPRCIPPKYEVVLPAITRGVAVGEIGLEEGGEAEVKVFKAQLRIAKENDLPCIIHTPRNNKEIITEKTLQILERISFPEELAVIDHLSPSTAEDVLKHGYYGGLSVQPGKLTPSEALAIVEEYGPERLMLNSDAGFSESEMDAVAKAGNLIAEKLGREVAEKAGMENAKKFFKV